MAQDKGRVCVTGGTGFLGSWIVKRLLQDGYSVNTTTRIDPERKRDISYITALPGAPERLHIFHADLDHPDTFAAAIRGCAGVFHVAHPLDFAEAEPEEVKIKRVTRGLEGILRLCADSGTVRRVVYTSSVSAAALGGGPGPGLTDEGAWTDVELVRSLGMFMGPYVVTKTVAERAALDLADELGLDLVTVLPTWISGPFICPNMPDTVRITMSLIFGEDQYYKFLKEASVVHVDDVARAHIHLMEYPAAKGRYINSAVEFKVEELYEFLSARYPEIKLPDPDLWKDIVPVKISNLSTKKLEETGFKYENGLEEIFDGAIKSCKEKGFL